MRSLFRANWRCLYPRAGGGGQHPEAHPTYLPHPLVYFQKRRSLLFYALASRRPLSPPPPPRPLTFELNIPSSPWTGIFYTSPNVVFVYSPCTPRGTRVHCLTSIILFSGGRGCYTGGNTTNFFGKFFNYHFFKPLLSRLSREKINWTSGGRYTSTYVGHVGCSKFGNTCNIMDNGSGNTVGANYCIEIVYCGYTCIEKSRFIR